jgi:hypothetical protein
MMDNNTSEPSIENVLKELKQDADQGDLPKEPATSDTSDSELKNLKNVLLEADLQAGSVPSQQEAILPNEKKEISFNENFLKLEKLIKELKGKE